MAIHREARAAHFDDRPDEAVLARLFDEAFDITYGTKDPGGLSYWLARPTQNAAERFGFQREIVVVYSPYKITDARTVRLFERVRDMKVFADRVDPSIGMVIHNGNPEELPRILETVQGYVLVPLLARDIRANIGRGFIRSQIAANLGEVDPFAVSSPIALEREFFGRNDITQALYAGLRAGQNAGLFGLRKTGKTSVLFALMRRLDAQAVSAIYVDCQSPGVHFSRWWQLLERIVQDWSDSLKDKRQRTAKVRLGYTEADAAQRFRRDVRTLLDDGAVEQLVLLLDEIEHVTPQISGRLSVHWDEDFLPFWQTLRAVHQEFQGRLAFVVAGVNPAAVESSHFSTVQNPIFELAVPHYLEPFDLIAMRDMVRTVGRYGGVRFDEMALDYIGTAYGGHPYLIRLACSEVWNRVERADVALSLVRSEDFSSAEEAIRDRLKAPVRDILLSLAWWYPDDYDLLMILAGGDAAFATQYLAESPLGHTRYTEFNLIDPGSGRFRIDAIRQFLLGHGEDYKRTLSPFARSDVEIDQLPEWVDVEDLAELFEKRTELENRLRRTILMFLGVHHGYSNERIARAIVGSLRKSPSRPDPGQLFVGREPKDAIQELYLEDLHHVIIGNWQVFSPLFENKGRFSMNMETANKARRVDAHTKSVSAEEREEFLNSFIWLLQRLRKVPEPE